MSVAIVTDSTICLPPELVEEHGITVVPLNLIFEDRSYRDGVDITPSEFYSLLEHSEKPPTTSAPSVGEFLDLYRGLSQRADSIACILLSSKLSGAFDSATQAKELAYAEFPETPITVVNSRTTTGALGFIVLEAARAASAGRDLDEIAEVIEDMMPRVQFFASLETLHYLAKTGRIGKAASWAGALLSVKPILTVPIDTGEVIPIERVRTKPRAIRRLLELMRDQVGTKSIHANVMHANVPKEADELTSQLLSQFTCTELFTSEFTPVMGTHTGPGLLGVAYYSDG